MRDILQIIVIKVEGHGDMKTLRDGVFNTTELYKEESGYIGE